MELKRSNCAVCIPICGANSLLWFEQTRRQRSVLALIEQNINKRVVQCLDIKTERAIAEHSLCCSERDARVRRPIFCNVVRCIDEQIRCVFAD